MPIGSKAAPAAVKIPETAPVNGLTPADTMRPRTPTLSAAEPETMKPCPVIAGVVGGIANTTVSKGDLGGVRASYPGGRRRAPRDTIDFAGKTRRIPKIPGPWARAVLSQISARRSSTPSRITASACRGSGEVSGSMTRTYEDDFRMASESVNGAWTVNYEYDDDNRLVVAGDESIERDPATGWTASTEISGLETRFRYNAVGEVEAISYAHSGADVYEVSYARDAGGRVRAKTETNPAETRIHCYDYDATGRLSTVRDAGRSQSR